MSNILNDTYNKMIAKARAQYNTSGSNYKQQKNLKSVNTKGDSVYSDFISNLGKKLGSKLSSSLFNNAGSITGQGAQGTYGNPYSAANGGIPENIGTFGQSPYAEADVGKYYSDIGAMGDASEASGSSMGGGGNAMAALAYLIAALKVRGYAGSGKSMNADLGEEEKPWEYKTDSEKVFSSPLAIGTSEAILGGGPLATGIFKNIVGEDHPYFKGYNWLAENEYKLMTPLYNLFIKGPSMNQRDNPLMNWGD
jgi:hypothetical protein